MYKEIVKCRICGNSELTPVLDLGTQYLTGIFPKDKKLKITAGPLELVKCHGSKGQKHCGLLQLRHSYDLNEMYGFNYGYRSGLNLSMVRHLHEKVGKICELVDLREGDLVIDIGSNDSTLLQGYPQNRFTLVGIDPTGAKFKGYYPSSICLIPDFFSSKIVREHYGSRKAKVITSVSMFYDLESPMDFMRQICDTLADDGIWVFEQSYMPTMLVRTAYDTVCHEHLEYYGLEQIKWMTDRLGLKIIDVELNDINGGSFSITVAKKDSPYKEASVAVGKLLADEGKQGFDSLVPFERFRERVFRHKEDITRFLGEIKAKGQKIIGYGASTKGNVILQFCNLTVSDMTCIAEINSDKFNSFTPGSCIPIISEEDAKVLKPDYLMVLPWHFRENIVQRESRFLQAGGKLFFPLPKLEVVGK